VLKDFIHRPLSRGLGHPDGIRPELVERPREPWRRVAQDGERIATFDETKDGGHVARDLRRRARR
jgi:hypothetical protein